MCEFEEVLLMWCVCVWSFGRQCQACSVRAQLDRMKKSEKPVYLYKTWTVSQCVSQSLCIFFTLICGKCLHVYFEKREKQNAVGPMRRGRYFCIVSSL